MIPFSKFKDVEMKVGTIMSVKDHPNADKLYVLKVDLGEEETRTIVAGLKEHYEKDQLEDKQAVFVSNLKPMKLRGIESNGMILATSNEDKSQVLIIQPEKPMPDGSKIN